MSLFRTIAILFFSFAAQGSEPQAVFQPAPAPAYPSHQTIGKVTFAAARYETDSDAYAAFGKVNPNEHGILPVLLVIENKSPETLVLNNMQVELMGSGGTRLQPTPAKDLPYLIGPKRPDTISRYPMPIPLPKKKNPLAGVGLDSRAWGARAILAGDKGEGFFYFQTTWRRGMYLYINGIREGASGKELFYAEVPLDMPSEATGQK